MPPPPSPSSPHEAVELLVRHINPVATERVPLVAAPGRILAEPIVADRPSPAADVSAMDGYAVRIADVPQGGGRLPVSAQVRIGLSPPPIPARTAIRIVTGAPIPAGADTVIQREHVEEHDDHIIIPPGTAGAARPGTAIRRRGENAGTGDQIAAPGRVIDPALAGAVASVGHQRPLVHRRVRVGILVTGDELLDVDSAPTDYQLRDSNGPALAALLGPVTWIQATGIRRAPDDPDAIHTAASALLSSCDLLFMSGGVSMGDRDFVPSVLDRLGATTLFHKIAQRPGRPVLAATGPRNQIILALPGNPVSVLVTARRLGGPVLQTLAGLSPLPPVHQARVTNPDEKTLDLWWFRLVRFTGPGEAELVEGKGSGDIASAAKAGGFVEVPPGQSGSGPWPVFPWSL